MQFKSKKTIEIISIVLIKSAQILKKVNNFSTQINISAIEIMTS